MVILRRDENRRKPVRLPPHERVAQRREQRGEAARRRRQAVRNRPTARGGRHQRALALSSQLTHLSTHSLTAHHALPCLPPLVGYCTMGSRRVQYDASRTRAQAHAPVRWLTSKPADSSAHQSRPLLPGQRRTHAPRAPHQRRPSARADRRPLGRESNASAPWRRPCSRPPAQAPSPRPDGPIVPRRKPASTRPSAAARARGAKA